MQLVTGGRGGLCLETSFGLDPARRRAGGGL